MKPNHPVQTVLSRLLVTSALLFGVVTTGAGASTPRYSDTTSVFFATNSFVVEAPSQTAILRLAHDVVGHHEKQVVILGYASVSGTMSFNVTLSQERADAVREVLLADEAALGGRALHVVCVGRGAVAFLPSTPDASANRRVDIVATA